MWAICFSVIVAKVIDACDMGLVDLRHALHEVNGLRSGVVEPATLAKALEVLDVTVSADDQRKVGCPDDDRVETAVYFSSVAWRMAELRILIFSTRAESRDPTASLVRCLQFNARSPKHIHTLLRDELSNTDQALRYLRGRDDKGITIADFVQSLRGEMPERRRQALAQLFAKLDVQADGSVQMDELHTIYKAAR